MKNGEPKERQRETEKSQEKEEQKAITQEEKLEENTITMQALVIAHAGYGHNSFFKGNYLFKTWTDASAIIDYLVFARHYLAECEQRHGVTAVEETLDSCHALMNYGVDRYKRPTPISAHEEKRRQRDREEALQRQVSELWKTFPDMQPVVQPRRMANDK